MTQLLSDEDPHAFVDEVIFTVNEKFDENLKVLATKEDLANLKTDLVQVFTRNLFLASVVQIASIVGLILGVLKAIGIY